MAVNAISDAVYSKIDPCKLSVFDLPPEVREKVILEYFLPAENYTIHLIRHWSEEDNGPERLKISTTEHHFLMSDLEIDTGYGNDGDETTTEKQVEKCSRVCKVWSNLEAAAKPLCAEAGKYHYLHDSFTVLGEFYDSQSYHAKLSVVPYRLLSKIKNLELHAWLFRDVFLSGRGSWREGPWSTVIGDMVNLRNLHLSELDGVQMQALLTLMTSRQSYFLGERPQVIVEVTQAGGKLWKRNPTRLSYVMHPPRLIIPPLKTFKLSGIAGKELLSGLDGRDWNGSTTVRLNVVSDGEGIASRKTETYLLRWPTDEMIAVSGSISAQEPATT